MDPRMSFKQLADEIVAKAWERYHGFMIDLPTDGMEYWEFNQGFHCGLSQEAKEEPSSCSMQKSMSSFREAFH
jgi:hypothetical protein